jgi:ArsR family transcriptional regulator, lead/cadmium/zinc/bismuth-responsive transcriptional repressor
MFNHRKSRPAAMASIDEAQAAQLADLFRLLGDSTRLRIVLACLEDPIAVGDMAAKLDLSPSLVSHHLRLLRAARIVRAERHGKQVFYSAADDHIRGLVTDMVEHITEPGTEDN